MDQLIAFGLGMLAGGALAIVSIIIVIAFINRAIDNDEDLRRLR